MEASLDTAVQAWGTINTGLRWCSGIDLVRSTPPLIEYDEFSDPEEDLVEKAKFSSRSEAGRYAAEQRWKNHAKQETLLTPTDDVALAQKTGQPIKWLLPATRDMQLKGILSSLAPYMMATGVSVQDFDSSLGDPAIKPLVKYLEDKGITGKPNFLISAGATNAELVAHGLVITAMQDLGLKLMQANPSGVDRSKSFEKAIQIATDGFPTVNMGISAFKTMADKGGRYKTQFEAGDSGGWFGPDLRAAFESSVLGLHPDMDATKRPVYGSMQTSASLKINEDVQMYGGIALQLKNNVRDRTTVVYNDSLGMATRSASANSVKDDSGDMFRTGMITEPFFYVEAQIHGGVSMDDVDAVWIHNFTGVDAEAPRRVREALDANGYTDIPVLRVGVDEPVEKATFSSRSEAGKYAAHIRWMNQRGMTPMTAEQWKVQNSDGSERMRKIQSMQADVSKRLQNLNDVLVKSGLGTESSWKQSRYGPDGILDDYIVVDPKDWGKTSIPEVSKSPMGEWLVEVKVQSSVGGSSTYYVPNAEVMALMEDVKTLGSLIEEEVQERINAENLRLATGSEAMRDFLPKLVNAQRVITHYETITSEFFNDFITFKADPNDPTPKFQQYVNSGQPKMIGNLIDYAPSLGEFIESNNSADEKVLVSALIEKTRSSVLELNKLGFDQNTSAKYRREVLAEIRSFGADEGTPYEIVTGFNFPNGAPVEVRIANAMQNLPTAWIDNLKTYTQTRTHKILRVNTVNELQSGFIEANHIIQTAANAQTAFVIHELVHAVEASSPVMRAMVHSFGVNRRVGNFRPSEEKFGSTFAQRLQTGVWEESGRGGYVEDSYFDKYSGRVYGGFAYSAHEQLTTGTDYSLFVNTIRPHDRIDSDQLAFTLGMWASA
jgi:Arc/MetJ-type ribon-helix-helix transcriptional regulator